MSQLITLRCFVNGDSYDIPMAAEDTNCGEELKNIVKSAIFGALIAVNGNYSDPQSAANVAEFIANIAAEKIKLEAPHSNGKYYPAKPNGYDSVYLKIKDFDFS